MILGLQDPWEISEVKLDAAAQKVEVVVVYKQGTLWACPESQQKLPIHDHVERSWCHLDTCQFETILVRRGESKELAAQDDDRLKGTRYLWLWHPGELKESRLDEFESLGTYPEFCVRVIK